MSRRRRARKAAARESELALRPRPALVIPYASVDVVRTRAVNDAPDPWPDLSTLTVVQLRARATELGVSLGKARTKASILQALGG